MKTYPIEILRDAFFQLVNRDKYVKFTLYIPPFLAPFGKNIGKIIGGRPARCKAKIEQIWGTKKGLAITFSHFWIKNSKNCEGRTAPLLLRDIRWIDSPFDEQKLEDLCIKLVKKLEAPKP